MIIADRHSDDTADAGTDTAAIATPGKANTDATTTTSPTAIPTLLATCWTTAGTALPYAGQSRSPIPLEQRVTAAADGGWQGFGLVHEDLVAYLERRTLADLNLLLDDHGIVHRELELIEDWWCNTSGDPERAADSERLQRELFAAAEAIGARTVKVGPETRGRPVDHPRFVEAFGNLADRAAEHGTRVAYEFLPFATHAPSLQDGIELVTEVGHSAGGLCVDIWHVARPGTDYGLIERELPGEYVFSVELNDAAPAVVGDLFADTVHRRLLPGAGSFDVPAFIRAIRATGFDGPWGVEILSDHHRTLPLERALRETREATLAAFAATDAAPALP